MIRLAPFYAALLLAAGGAFAQPKSASVSLLEGKATRTSKGRAPVALTRGSAIAAGDVVETQDDTRLEIRFSDASVLRLGAKAKLQLTDVHFGGPAKRRLSARLFFGRIWAKVTSAIQGDNKFQIETENAIAGVRGTTFRVDSREDESVLVRVYDGAVAVAKNVPASQGGKPGERHEVAGPEEVSRDQWEKLVGAQMQIVIAADGSPGEPEPFDAAADRDDPWARWNTQRDQAGR